MYWVVDSNLVMVGAEGTGSLLDDACESDKIEK